MTKFSRGLGDPSVCDRLGIPPSARVVGIVANLRPVKDHELFLRAAKIVAGEIEDAVFLLVGRGGLYQQLCDLASELGIRERVFFTQGEGNVMDYLVRMSIGCLTSFQRRILQRHHGVHGRRPAVGGHRCRRQSRRHH